MSEISDKSIADVPVPAVACTAKQMRVPYSSRFVVCTCAAVEKDDCRCVDSAPSSAASETSKAL